MEPLGEDSIKGLMVTNHRSQPWYAVYTKPRQEDAVADKLSTAGIEVFNPKLREKKTIKRRLCEVIGPLFPCYLFVRFDIDSNYRLVKYTRGVRSLVGGNNPIPVGEDIIETIKSRMNGGIAVMQIPHLNPGDRIVVREGPLKDLSGIFERELSGIGRVSILINAISYQARVVIEKELLKKV